MKFNRVRLFFLIAGISVLSIVLVIVALTPAMNRWGVTYIEPETVHPGDELDPMPDGVNNRAVTIDAPAELIYPWLVQMGVDRGWRYSYTALEVLINCPIVNADRIRKEWQDLQVGDAVKLCPNDPASSPYIVAQILPDRALTLVHQNAVGNWTDSWSFTLLPTSTDQSRLLIHTRTILTGSFWAIIHPVFSSSNAAYCWGSKNKGEIKGILISIGYLAEESFFRSNL